jgi:hypothetical protein
MAELYRIMAEFGGILLGYEGENGRIVGSPESIMGRIPKECPVKRIPVVALGEAVRAGCRILETFLAVNCP